MRFGPRQLEDVGQKPFGEAVPAHDALGQHVAGVGELDPAVGGDEALVLEAAHHLAHCGPAHLESLGDARLDDVDVILLQLEDALAVLLERWMMFARGWHVRQPTVRPAPGPWLLTRLFRRWPGRTARCRSVWCSRRRRSARPWPTCAATGSASRRSGSPTSSPTTTCSAPTPRLTRRGAAPTTS